MSHFSPSKRRLFRVDQSPLMPRPPWALDEYAYVDSCSGCKRCVEACETGILISDKRGQARVDFSRGECTFCEKCVAACEDGALTRPDNKLPWMLRINIDNKCLTKSNVVCQSCGDVCELAAIRFAPVAGGVSQPTVNEEACNGCGACLSICPTQAISLTNPEQDEVFHLVQQSI